MKKMMMAVGLLVALGATNALGVTILTIESDEFLGQITPVDNSKASLTQEASYINTLLDMLTLPSEKTVDGFTYRRSDKSCMTSPCADATDSGAVKNETTPQKYQGIDVSGYQYLMAKYDGPNYGWAVWDVTKLYTVDIPNTLPPDESPSYGISHFSLFNPIEKPKEQTPDGGVTLMLLGGALVGFETLRRRLRA